jgi:hemoglobin-like flavoprotein
VFAQTGSGQEQIQRLGDRHRQLHVKPIHYQLWLDALCESLAAHDREFCPALEQMWREAMMKGIKVMSDG